jgi:uncharacterized Zn-binding protein involved in type VI secretion
MTPPPINIDGSKVSAVTIDGQNVSQITIDGQDVLSAIPDSVVLNAKASSYDGPNNEYKSNIGPNIPDGGGDPSATTITDGNGDSVSAVRYNRSNGDFSKLTSGVFPFSGINSQAIVYTCVNRTGINQNSGRYLDGGSLNEFNHAVADTVSGDPHRISTNGFNTTATAGSVTTSIQTFALVDDGTHFQLFKSSPTNSIIKTGSDFTPLTGLTLAAEGDNDRFLDLDLVEVSVMKDQTPFELTSEINRQISEYGT